MTVNPVNAYKYLILVELTILVLLFSFLLECDDDKTHKNVDHEECDDDDVDKVVDGDLHAVVVYWAEPLAIRVNACVHQTEKTRKTLTCTSTKRNFKSSIEIKVKVYIHLKAQMQSTL